MKLRHLARGCLLLFVVGCGAARDELVEVFPELEGSFLTSFGTSGVKVEAGSGGGDDVINASAVDGQGRLVVVGSTVNGSGNKDLLVMRMSQDGALDSDFATSGIFTDDSAAGGSGDDEGFAVFIGSANDIWVAGRSSDGTNFDGAVWHITSAGTLDTSFSGDGRMTDDNFSDDDSDQGADELRGVAVANDGDILLAGMRTTSGGTTAGLLGKITSSGVLRAGFDPVNGDSSVQFTNTAGGSGNETVNTMLYDTSTGLIYLAGSSVNASANTDLVIWRYLITGAQDSSFSGGSVVISDTAGTGNDSANAMALLGSNIAICGTSNNGAGLVPIVLNINSSSGASSVNFNGGSPLVITTGAGGTSHDVSGIVVDSRSNIYCIGESSNGADRDMAIWRVTSSGALDTDFNLTGFFSHHNAAGGAAADIGKTGVLGACQKRMFVSGSSNNGANTDSVVWAIQ